MRVSDSETQFVDKAGLDHTISELKAYIDGLTNGGMDLSDYVTKTELQAKLDALNINIDLSAYATKEELTQAINSIDLSSYATKSEIPSLDGYAKLTDLPTKVSQLENDNNYLTSVPEEYVTETELNAKGYLTEHQDLSSYALKEEIPSLDGYATTEYVDNAIANVPSGGGNVDLSNYYTKEETNALIPSTEGLATEEYVSTAINSIPATDLSNYYTKDEVYSKSETDALIPTVTDGKDGITPHIDSTTKHWMIGDTDTGVVAEGVNGTDGVSPTVTVTKEGSVATITCTDVNGTTTATISDGAEGSSSGGGSANNDYTLNTEVEIGTYFGKTLYRKVVQLDEIKVGTHKIARTSIVSESIDVKKIGGQFINAYSEKMNIPFFESTSSYVSAYLTDYDSNIAIISKVPSTHGSAWAYGYLYIEYTKNS